jgi:hypothetical protein
MQDGLLDGLTRWVVVGTCPICRAQRAVMLLQVAFPNDLRS